MSLANRQRIGSDCDKTKRAKSKGRASVRSGIIYFSVFEMFYDSLFGKLST